MAEVKQEPETEERDFEIQFSESGQVGQVQIGDDVIARIVAIAATEVEGITLESKFALSDLIGGRKEREQVKGIVVERGSDDSNRVRIQISVRMEYGRDMYDLALQLRNHVKATVEKMTRVSVNNVDIRIIGINVREKDRERLEKESEE